MSVKQYPIKRQRRKKRVRAKITGTLSRPRLSVFRSAKYIYAQIIDDAQGHTLIAASNLVDISSKLKKTEAAKMVGEKLAKLALKKGIKEIVFDRSGYKYHGRVKALAEGARSEGLKF